jgi:hypothetical protein
MDEAKEKIQKYFDIWTEQLGLRWWDITVHYFREPSEILENFRSDNNPDKLIPAFVNSYWNYLKADIYINLPEFVGMEEEHIEEIVAHELCHVLVSEMHEEGMRHEERVATILQKAFIWVREYARDEGMEAVK